MPTDFDPLLWSSALPSNDLNDIDINTLNTADGNNSNGSFGSASSGFVSFDGCFNGSVNSDNSNHSGSDSGFNHRILVQNNGNTTPPYTPHSSPDRLTPSQVQIPANHAISVPQVVTSVQYSNHHFIPRSPVIIQPPSVSVSLTKYPIAPKQPLLWTHVQQLHQATTYVQKEKTSSTSSGSDEEMKRREIREARKIRNRESASKSAMKQKDMVSQLQSMVDSLKNDNCILKTENQNLKNRIRCLENKIKSLCGPIPAKLTKGVSKKRTMSLMAVIFMMGLNFAPFTTFFFPKETAFIEIKPSSPAVRTGRTLLWESAPDVTNSSP